MTAAAVARLFSVPVPVAVIEGVVPLTGDERDLLVDDGLARPNPLLPGAAFEDVAAVWRAFAAWLATADAPGDRLLLDGVLLALDAADPEAARLLLRRVALGAVVAQTTPEPAEALLSGGRIADLMALDPDAVLLVLADAGRVEAEPLFEAEWLQGRLALARGRPGDAVVAAAGPWSDVVAADALCLTGRVDEAEARLAPWFTPEGHLTTAHPPLLRGELLRAGARVFSEATRFDEAATARTELEDLAAELGEPRVQLAVLLGRVGQGYRRGHFLEARRWLREFDELAARVPSAGLRDNADYIAAVLATYGGEDPDLAARSARSTSKALAPFWAILRGVLAFQRGEPGESRARLREAAEDVGPAVAAAACEVALFQGDLEGARVWAERMPAAWPLLGAAGQVHRARLAWLQGDEPPPLPRPFRNRMVETLACLFDAERALGDRPSVAATRAQRALALIDAHGLGAWRSDAWALLADAAARRGDRDEARRHLERARDHLVHPDAPAAGWVTAAACALDGTPPTDAWWATWAARRDWRALGLAAREHEPSPEARAVLESLSPRLRHLAAASFPTEPTAAPLRVGEGWFQAPGGDRRDLSRRHALRRIVEALVERRLETPGDALTVDDLLEAGWPGEQVMPFAGRNRVHVALTTLRGLGLRGLIEATDEGYRLDPAVPVVRVGQGTRDRRTAGSQDGFKSV